MHQIQSQKQSAYHIIIKQFKKFKKIMDPQKKVKKPNLSDHRTKPTESVEQKLKKIQKYYMYRLPSVYRELKRPIYDQLLMQTKQPNNNNVNKFSNSGNKSIGNNNADKSSQGIEYKIQILYKKVTLNSKYHHRQKMRFSRTPLLKYLKYNFQNLQEKLKSKSYIALYDDLEQSDQQDEGKEDKKQYQPDPYFSSEALFRYKKKNGITGNIVSACGYDDVKRRLVQQYGWVENQDTKSLFYDYKHMSKKNNIDYVNLLEDQVVNHFHENKSVTAKFGLTRNIRNICSIGKDPSQFFPRCFDVNDVIELQNFYESFKETYVQSMLKKFINTNGSFPQSSNMGLYEKIIQKCIDIIERQFMQIEKKIELIQKQKNIYITQQQWDFLQQYQKIQQNNMKEQGKVCINQKLLQRAKRISSQAQKIDPQWNINKDNIWIVKPASLSRGRGIKTFNEINQIFDYVIGKQISWVAQKYIENPLIIKKRKFDIRQWVILTDFKPFRVWIYEQCYIRFCATVYSPENLKDRKIHLTNNSVTKGVSDIKGDGIDENMLSQQQFSKILAEKEGSDVFKQKIKGQMKKIAVQTLQSVKQNMVPRKNTFQIFGFDFMVDENYKVWLIQVNSSPTMQYSTKVTTSIVQKGMSDLGDLVNNYMFKGKFYNKAKSQQLYGGWKLLTNP